MLNADKNIFVKKRKTLLDNLKNDGSVDDMISIARIIEYQQILRFENTRFKKFKFPKIDSGKKLIDKWLEKIDLKVSLKDYDDLIDLSFFMLLSIEERIAISRSEREKNIQVNEIPLKKIEKLAEDKELLKWLKVDEVLLSDRIVFLKSWVDEHKYGSRASHYLIRPFLSGLRTVHENLESREESSKEKKLNFLELFRIFDFDDYKHIDTHSALNRINQFYSSIPYSLDT